DEARHAEAVSQLLRYLAGELKEFWVDLDLRGTSFQRSVWAVARAIPYGGTLSYREVAARAGRPRATRAVGQAMGANPLPLFIPCHRVVCADGRPGGFGWGQEWKLFLLELEKNGRGGAEKALRFTRPPSDT
ncbi:MAG: methylated-DNA--[protein]-cysteine S-methyltransferase, partial [Bacillota bacterium]|nr:methylated-DNA--[protein]-cysteine S-methyltransferase [Bacillota bacterium]